MSVHKEIKLEDEICDRLSNQGWIYEADSNTKYDSALALFPEDVSDWVKDTPPRHNGCRLLRNQEPWGRR